MVILRAEISSPQIIHQSTSRFSYNSPLLEKLYKFLHGEIITLQIFVWEDLKLAVAVVTATENIVLQEAKKKDNVMQK